MIRTQLQLTKEQYRRLRHWTTLLDKSIAQQAREAIDSYLARLERQEGKKVKDVAGKFAPLTDPAQDIKEHDRLYAESIHDRKQGN